MSVDFDRPHERPARGQILFAMTFFALSALLLSQIDQQTRWTERTMLFAQPRFWPAVGLGGMVFFGALHWLTLPRKRILSDDGWEAWRWLLAFEWVIWFLIYVLLVPIAGYLPTTILFSVLLAKRVGYFGRRWTITAAAFGIAAVLLFKSFMGVKIPGALAYEYLPSAIRTFFIVNF